MIRLLPTQTLEIDLAGAVATTELDVVCSFSDATASGYAGSTQTAQTNGTTETTIVSAPPTGAVRDVDYVNVYNRDTATATVTIQIDTSATNRFIIRVSLLTGEQLNYTHGSGWCAIDANGNRKEVTSSIFSSITDTGLTSGRVVYAGTGGLLQDSANLTFNGTTLTANTIGAFTLSGTIAGGGNQLNNIIIGTTTPLAGSFTTLAASSTSSFGGTMSVNANITFAGVATPYIISGSSGINFRNTGNSADILTMTTGGAITIPGTLGVSGATTLGTRMEMDNSAGNSYIRHNGTSGDLYIATAAASSIRFADDTIIFRTAVSGTAGNAISWVETASAAPTIFTIGVSGAGGTIFNDGSEVYFPGAYAATTGSAANVFVDSAGKLYRSTSRLSAKNLREDLTLAEAKSIALGNRALRFTMKDGPAGEFIGYGAELVAEKDPRLAVFDPDGKPSGVQYATYVVPHGMILDDHESQIQSLLARLGKAEAALSRITIQ